MNSTPTTPPLRRPQAHQLISSNPAQSHRSTILIPPSSRHRPLTPTIPTSQKQLRNTWVIIRATQESAIDDFAAATLRLLGFRAPNTTVATCYTIPLSICAEMRTAHADTCVIRRPKAVLLVLVKDKSIFDSTAAIEVESQVVAGAIAAFQFNNARRAENGRPTLEAMTVPCITISGTTPTFYLVPVTKELSDAVVTGQYPTSQTQVLRCVAIATHPRRVSHGMADLEFRKIVLKRFLAFKDLAKSHWQQYMV